MVVDGGFDSVQQSVAATATVTAQLREATERMRGDPSKGIGLTAEEMHERKRRAAEARKFFSEPTRRPFEVRSSSRAQQIMSEGVVERQVSARQRDVLKKMASLRKLQVGLCAVGAGIVYWIGVEFLLPHYAAVQERNRILKLRLEMVQKKREEFMRMREQSASSSP